MKKLLALLILLTAGLTLKAQLYVGHRGSLYGVENTKESFQNGCKLGYDFLETDIRVTKDGQFICSHDPGTARLAPDSLEVAETTLAELKALPLKQTRGGVEYTGQFCTLQEYLDICRENNVRPLIELKWATGVNNDDFSNIPALIELIEKNGFRNNCVILTSMKKCLENIRENYPDITLQFLTGQYWPNHFDWCVEKGMDVDIQQTYFTADDVKKFHDAGLKVNVWSVNDPQRRDDYSAWGCDFITTDKLPKE